MKNIKTVLIYSMLIFTTIRTPHSNAIGLRAETEILVSGGIKLADKLGPTILEATKNAAHASANIGVEAAKILGPSAVEVSKNVVETSANVATAVETGGSSLVDASSNLGVNAAAKGVIAVQGLTVVAGIAVTIYGVTQLYPIGKEIYTAAFPSEEQQRAYAARLIESRKRLRFLEAEDQFTECIIKAKKDMIRNNSGLPFKCEESARMFAMLGGKNQVKEMTETFNEYSQPHE